ncbi:hypothetical protein CASFOL_017418 [Castilleja foliolosa]|uniref:Uncharacterized protein n=1 Tax=Castilleja foliolosa TaxID=1961234 RepID=A0ABD3DD58_9LAMI
MDSRSDCFQNSRCRWCRSDALMTVFFQNGSFTIAFPGPHEDLESYLQAIDQLRTNIQFFSNNKSFKSSDGVLNHSNTLLAKAISKLEKEFKQLLSSYSVLLLLMQSVEHERLLECLPNSMRPSGSPEDNGGKIPSSNHADHQNSTTENYVYTTSTLIPPRILPLLHDLAQQMIQAGNQHQLQRLYSDIRSPVLEESLQKLGVEKLSKDDVQKMQWEVLEAKTGNWIHFMRIVWAEAIESLYYHSRSDKSFGMKQRRDGDIEIDEKFW